MGASPMRLRHASQFARANSGKIDVRASHNAYRPFERGVTEAPDNYYVCSCDQAREFLDLIEQFEHGDEARAFAEEISRAKSCRSRPATSPEIAHLGGNADGSSVGGRFSCTVWGLNWGPLSDPVRNLALIQ